MVRISPFKAIAYNTARQRDLSSVLAPPYDVIDQQRRNELIARDEHNIVRIDLPHMPPASLGPTEAYIGSAKLLDDWLGGGVLSRDSADALYYYQQTFTIGSVSHTRSAFFGRVRLEELGAGSVMPHEQTFSGPKEDRLALTKATRCNLSPVFALYPDADNEVLTTLSPGSAEPDCTAELDGISNKLWAVRDRAVINRVAELMAKKTIYIADGHHRYGTSLNYRKFLAESGESISAEHPANFINMVLVSAADPGLVILPTHRFVSGLGDDYVSRLPGVVAESFDWVETDLGAEKMGEFGSAISRMGPKSMGIYDAKIDTLFVLAPKSGDPLAYSRTDISPALRGLSVVILHEYLLGEKMVEQISPGSEPKIAYVKELSKGLDLARQGQYRLAFLPQATTMDELLAVVQAGELMPQKSTFFYPKIPTGLVINPLY